MTQHSTNSKTINMGMQLRMIRNEAQISQSSAAVKVYRTPQGNVSSLERGRLFPSIEQVSAAYYSMGFYKDLSDFLLPSWMNKLYSKNPYSKVFKSVQDLKDTIISYAQKFPFYRIEKDELLKFYKDRYNYTLSYDAMHISPHIFNNNDRISKIGFSESENKMEPPFSNSNIDIEPNSAIICYLEDTLYNIKALLTLIQGNSRGSELSKNPPNILPNILDNWIENELKGADTSKLLELKKYWDTNLK